MRIGLDIGSTTIKCVALNQDNVIIYESYERHFSQIVNKAIELLERLKTEVLDTENVHIAISGSAGMGLSTSCNIPFVQEVYATRVAAKQLLGDTDVIIELGGEDAKILFLTNGMEVRMNGSCAGGTGAFIDQMSTLLHITPDEMNDCAKNHEKLYTIASRCGVFAKSDIQPLLNQGAKKEDISASIFYAVVNQTIAGLAQGRPIEGKVVYLGGPLTFLSELRESFDKTLKLTGIFPENSLYYVALGAAFSANETVPISSIIDTLKAYHSDQDYESIPPLFKNIVEYDEFSERHRKASVPTKPASGYKGDAYLGIDAGSTTVKTVILDKDGNLIHSKYQPNSGNPVPLIKAYLDHIYRRHPNINIVGACSTGYGEDIVKNAFNLDFSIVETVAHFTAAKQFMPNVEFIIDIGGQDIKCFKIVNGVIDNIYLNEACSSGCGSFLQTFANALDYSIADFAKLGIMANKPVDLGSRCTVFMNSSVKQAQKEGVSIDNISAGLSISVVKNALYKVIRATRAEELGKHIVVQGGTFLNDAVLRAFEQELKTEVVRPTISGLMGAFGAALYAKQHSKGKSTILDYSQIVAFEHDVKVVSCGLCSNNCRLTVNTFGNDRKFIGGNRCERPITSKIAKTDLNIYDYKYELLKSYRPVKGKRGKIGIPMGLNMYELLPFWYAFLTSLGFEVITSPNSTRKLYLLGQSTIPSDTICFPAKLMHGHIQALIDDGIDKIFYPCLTYNLNEGLGDNHFNCPVVAYYPETIAGNMPDVQKIWFFYEYLGIHRQKDFTKKILKLMQQTFPDITKKEVENAVIEAFSEHKDFLNRIRDKGEQIIKSAREQGLEIIVLAGRPYHVDPEVNHGIDKLIVGCGSAIISEEVISHKVEPFRVEVLNQWTYHSRLYAAAKYIADQKDMNLVQLVSFGCGVDAITTDEIRRILEQEGKIYTQLKIDEITNLGAVKIRLRSLFAAIE